MSKRGLLIGAVIGIWLLCSCETLVTAYLINELLNDQAPAKQWTGTVRDSTGSEVANIRVEVVAEYEGDSDIITYDDTTDENGDYSIKYRWNSNIMYSIRVVSGGAVLATEAYGQIELGDRETDFIIQGSTHIELSGVINDVDGNPLQGVVVIGASALTSDANPTVLLDGEGDPQYHITNESGIYNLQGTVARYGIVCAYHPDHGFAYADGEDSNDDGTIPLNIRMGNTGDFDVNVQVVDGTGSPIVLQVLPASRQFRLRLSQPWNLSSVIDDVVTTAELFQGLVGNPSDAHPTAITIDVQATSLNGMAENGLAVKGGVYQLELLNIQNDDPATALITSEDPLVLAGDATVVVRVN